MSDIEEVRLVTELFHKDNERIRVAVKDAGHGPAVDVRTFFTAEPGETKMVKRGGAWKEVPAYCGHSRNGFWISNLEMAAELGTAILEAVEVAERYSATGPPPEDWTCPQCNAENDGAARRCHACDASRRRDFLAVEA